LVVTSDAQPVSDAWGLSSGPAIDVGDLDPLPAALAELAAAREPYRVERGWREPSVRDLPETQQLQSQGWVLLDGAPVHEYLPAVWPAEHRSWLHDRLPRCRLSKQRQGWLVTPTVGDTLSDLIKPLGGPRRDLYPPPEGRLWFVRSPFAFVGVNRLYELFDRRVREQGWPVVAETVTDAAADVLHWDGSALRRWMRAATDR
jgi:hypothetical protein